MEMICNALVGEGSIGVVADVCSLLGYGGNLDAEGADNYVTKVLGHNHLGSHMCSKTYDLFSIIDYAVFINKVSSFPSSCSEKLGTV
jgi:hypothetical protein